MTHKDSVQGAKLSLQMHHNRADHWVVVSGSAKVTNGDKTYLLSENESAQIPRGVVHALENPGKEASKLLKYNLAVIWGKTTSCALRIGMGDLGPALR